VTDPDNQNNPDPTTLIRSNLIYNPERRDRHFVMQIRGSADAE
jgi:hypothetical protein